MIVTEQNAVIIYSDLMAFLMMLGMVCLSSRFRGRRSVAARLFLILCVGAMAEALLSMVCYSLHGQTFSWGRPAAWISKTLLEMTMLVLVFHWVMYVDFKLYGSRDRLIRTIAFLTAPLGLCALLLIVNLFTGIVFTINEDLTYTGTVIYDVLMAVEFLYLLVPLFQTIVYHLKGHRFRFFRIAPVLIPAMTACIVDLTTPYSAAALGISIGLVFLYFSLVSEWRFEDRETGLCNKEYLRYLHEQVLLGRRTFRYAMTFTAGGDPGALVAILKQEAPGNAELIRTAHDSCVLLTENGDRSALELLRLLVEDAAGEYDAAHENGRIDLHVQTYASRKDDVPAALTETLLGKTV
ncbi:MAG: hypothetical protein IKO80_01510 [Lachnospiraceae bacterium]|nr:hypothetical protein [Lachnospiraceae bacterium]